MQWLNKLVDEIVARKPEGEILVESGASPSGTYHFGHLREIVTCDAIVLALRQRGREARHIHFVDNLDALRKIPANIPAEFEKYLGKPLCDTPAPDGSDRSYADYFLQGLLDSAQGLGIEVEIIYSHQKYRSGFFIPAIEKTLDNVDKVRNVLETVGGRQLDEFWSPIQVMEDGYLKSRTFVNIDKAQKTLTYKDRDGNEHETSYAAGEVKLDWRVDWAARWWLLDVDVEPFGRDHATKGGSYDTGAAIDRDIFEIPGPIPVPYDFINLAGDNKKMSASRGTGIEAAEVIKVLPAEVVRFFILRYPPNKRLYFDQVQGTIQLVDEFAELAAKPDKTEAENLLIYLCTRGLDHKTVSRVPFSHLVTSYQAALKDADNTIQIAKRTEHAVIVGEDAEIIKNELKFIDEWLKNWAPEDVKFELLEKLDASMLSDVQKQYLSQLADKIAGAPEDADGEWFHKAIYEFKDYIELAPKELFTTLYQVIIGKDSGPRAGWFLSLLPRDWLIKRLRMKE
ncbi:MAG: lysine--tRNA ligase [Patescibacteria group bacterium]